MKRWGQCLLALCMAVSLCACTATAEELTGEAEGYGGPLKVAVKVENEKITQVRVISHQETEGVGTKAIDALPDAIVAANSTQVDIVSGATYTSRAILAAVDQAMSGGTASPTAQAAATDPTQDGRRTGLGMSALGRLGPGSDADGNPVYSFNVVFCSAAFDAAGRIQEVLFDQLEVTSSNIGDASTPQFSGFPGQTDIQGKDTVTEEQFLQQLPAWITKRAKGDSYKLNTAPWYQEMDAYQRFFIGKTVEEVDAWFAKYCSDETGRPLTAESSQEADQEKYNALTDAEKKELADITSSATMSLKDNHGDLLAALHNAWEMAQK